MTSGDEISLGAAYLMPLMRQFVGKTDKFTVGEKAVDESGSEQPLRTVEEHCDQIASIKPGTIGRTGQLDGQMWHFTNYRKEEYGQSLNFGEIVGLPVTTFSLGCKNQKLALELVGAPQNTDDGITVQINLLINNAAFRFTGTVHHEPDGDIKFWTTADIDARSEVIAALSSAKRLHVDMNGERPLDLNLSGVATLLDNQMTTCR